MTIQTVGFSPLRCVSISNIQTQLILQSRRNGLIIQSGPSAGGHPKAVRARVIDSIAPNSVARFEAGVADSAPAANVAAIKYIFRDTD